MWSLFLYLMMCIKFLGDPRNEEPDLEQTVPSMEEFCPIYEIALDDNTLLIYSAELDGVREENMIVNGDEAQILGILNQTKLIELKTSPPSLKALLVLSPRHSCYSSETHVWFPKLFKFSKRIQFTVKCRNGTDKLFCQKSKRYISCRRILILMKMASPEVKKSGERKTCLRVR